MIGQAATTMNQLQKKLDVISHNLANLNTQGYKTRKTEFQSLLTQHLINLSDASNAVGRVTPDGIRVGTGAKVGSIQNHLAIGSMQRTDRALDTMLLHENHFYQIRVVENGIDEIRYTRDGAFYLSPINNGEQVELVTSEGHRVVGENGPIRFRGDFDDIKIDERGNVIINIGEQEYVVGTLDIVEITRPRLLEAAGSNGFRLPNLAELGYNFADIVQAPQTTDPLVQNGVIEMSNVQLQDEMTEMIIAQRAYQLNARAITTADQMQGLINQLR